MALQMIRGSLLFGTLYPATFFPKLDFFATLESLDWIILGKNKLDEEISRLIYEKVTLKVYLKYNFKSILHSSLVFALNVQKKRTHFCVDFWLELR